MKKQRDSGIELLRIVAMLMVIGVHIFLYGGYFDRACEYNDLVKSSAYFLKLFFRPAVNIFVVITGYFMVRSAFDLKASYKRLLSLYGTVYFYSIVLGIIFFAGQAHFETSRSDTLVLLRMFLPLTFQEWYFLTDYFLMCLFAPFVNIILQKLSKKEYLCLLTISIFVMSIWQYIMNIDPFLQEHCNYGYEGIVNGKNVFSFLYVYMLGGYVGLHMKPKKRPNFVYLIGIFLCVWANYFIWMNYGEVLNYNKVAISYTNPFIVSGAVLFLLFFKDLHFHSRLVNLLGSTTIGIYALHEMEYVRNFIWEKLSFAELDCSNLGTNLLRIFIIMLFVFFTGAIIDLLRQQIFKGIGALWNMGKGIVKKDKGSSL